MSNEQEFLTATRVFQLRVNAHLILGASGAEMPNLAEDETPLVEQLRTFRDGLFESRTTFVETLKDYLAHFDNSYRLEFLGLAHQWNIPVTGRDSFGKVLNADQASIKEQLTSTREILAGLRLKLIADEESALRYIKLILAHEAEIQAQFPNLSAEFAQTKRHLMNLRNVWEIAKFVQGIRVIRNHLLIRIVLSVRANRDDRVVEGSRALALDLRDQCSRLLSECSNLRYTTPTAAKVPIDALLFSRDPFSREHEPFADQVTAIVERYLDLYFESMSGVAALIEKIESSLDLQPLELPQSSEISLARDWEW